MKRGRCPSNACGRGYAITDNQSSERDSSKLAESTTIDFTEANDVLMISAIDQAARTEKSAVYVAFAVEWA